MIAESGFSTIALVRCSIASSSFPEMTRPTVTRIEESYMIEMAISQGPEEDQFRREWEEGEYLQTLLP